MSDDPDLVRLDVELEAHAERIREAFRADPSATMPALLRAVSHD